MELPYREKPGAVRAGALHDISFNCRVKSYPGGGQQVLVCEAPIFRRTGWEEARRVEPAKRGRKAPLEARDGPGGAERAMRRARAQVRDLALCTPFRYFVTLTLDKMMVDRYDMKAITGKLNRWLDNQVRRKGLAYVLVPERHKDGAVHFHGFFNDALEVTDSGTISRPGGGRPRRPRSGAQREQWLAEGGRVVYNLPGWSLGFTTAIALYGEYSRAVGYVCKYIGKGGEKIGGRWYYSGGDLGRPEVTLCHMPLSQAAAWEGAYSFTVRGAHLGFVLVNVKGGEAYGAGPGASGDAAVRGGTVPLRGLLPEGDAAGLRGVPVQT